MTPEEWARCVLVLRSVYTHSFKLDKEGIAVWFELLKDLPGPNVLAAVMHMAKFREAFPNVAEIRQFAEGRTEDEAALAWKEACDKAHHCLSPFWRDGVEVPVEWSDPKIPKALDAIGGPRAYCESKSDDLPAMRAHFYRAYKALQEKESLLGTYASLGIAPPKRPEMPAGIQKVLDAPVEPQPRPKRQSVAEKAGADRVMSLKDILRGAPGSVPDHPG